MVPGGASNGDHPWPQKQKSHGAVDPLNRLRAVSDEPVLYAEFHGSQHAFDLFPSIRANHVIEAVERFLRAVRKGSLPADATVSEKYVEQRASTKPPATATETSTDR